MWFLSQTEIFVHSMNLKLICAMHKVSIACWEINLLLIANFHSVGLLFWKTFHVNEMMMVTTLPNTTQLICTLQFTWVFSTAYSFSVHSIMTYSKSSWIFSNNLMFMQLHFSIIKINYTPVESFNVIQCSMGLKLFYH